MNSLHPSAQTTLLVSIHQPHNILTTDDALNHVLGHRCDEVCGKDMSIFFGPVTDSRQISKCICESTRALTSLVHVYLYSSTRQPKMILLQAAPFYDALGQISGCALRASLGEFQPHRQLSQPITVDLLSLADAVLSGYGIQDGGVNNIATLLFLAAASGISCTRAPAGTSAQCQPPFHNLALGSLSLQSLANADAVPRLPAFLASFAAPQPPAASEGMRASDDGTRLSPRHTDDSDARAQLRFRSPSKGPRVSAFRDLRPHGHGCPPCRPAAATRQQSGFNLAAAGGPGHASVSAHVRAVGAEFPTGGARAGPGPRRGAPLADRRGRGPRAAAVVLVDEGYVRRLRRRHTATDRREAAAAAAAALQAAAAAASTAV